MFKLFKLRRPGCCLLLLPVTALAGLGPTRRRTFKFLEACMFIAVGPMKKL